MTQPVYPGMVGGGWPTNLKRFKATVGPDLAWLASQHYSVKVGGVTLKKGTASATAVNEVQTLATSTATGGSFKLSFRGQTTAAIAFGATSTQIRDALRALSTIGSTGVSASGGPANSAPVVITFDGVLVAGANQPLIETDTSLLTGGTTTGFSETTRGQAANVVEVLQGTFLVPEPAGANFGYYRPALSGDTIDDYANEISGFAMASVNLADSDVAVGLLIHGSVKKERIQPYPLFTNIKTAIAGRISVQ